MDIKFDISKQSVYYTFAWLCKCREKKDTKDSALKISFEISNINTSREKKKTPKFKISNMNKHPQQREKDTKALGSEDLI
jgi:hypothetical protein